MDEDSLKKWFAWQRRQHTEKVTVRNHAFRIGLHATHHLEGIPEDASIIYFVCAASSCLDDPLLIKFSGWYIPGLDFIYIYIIQVQIFVFSL
jgi:hypothetical protein